MCRVLNKHHAGVPAGAVYIGRGSKWGNPFRIGRDGNRAIVIAKFERWLADSISRSVRSTSCAAAISCAFARRSPATAISCAASPTPRAKSRSRGGGASRRPQESERAAGSGRAWRVMRASRRA
jgi:uncharacterized protein DUF4326